MVVQNGKVVNEKVWLYGIFPPYNKGRSWHIVKLLVFHPANKRKPNRLKSKVFSSVIRQKVISLLNWPGFHSILTLCANEQDSSSKECLFWLFITGWHHLSPSGVTFQSRWLDISHSQGYWKKKQYHHDIKQEWISCPTKKIRQRNVKEKKMIDGNFKLRGERRPSWQFFYRVFLHDK